MGIYRFRMGTLWRDDDPMALYAGNRRLSPPEALVWWWPVNWLAVVFLAVPILIFRAVRKIFHPGN